MHIKWTPSTCESVASALRIASDIYVRNAFNLRELRLHTLAESLEQQAGEAIHLAEWLESGGDNAEV